MTTTSLAQRIERTEPLAIDTIIALGLTLLVFVQIAALSMIRPDLPGPAMEALRGARGGPGLATYLVAAGAFLPLVVRRQLPWLSLLLTSIFALIYMLNPFPPAFVLLGPMIAMYSAAAYGRERYGGFVAILVGGLIVATIVFTFISGFRGAMEIISAFVMLAAAAFLGDTLRNRREYIAEVEQRAMEAERTREEEALRRVDEERIRIAREVHDIVAHSLSIVAVQANAADALLPEDPEKARESIAHIRTTSKGALDELRSMLDVLRTSDKENELAPAPSLATIERLVEPVREAGLDVALTLDISDDDVPAYAAVSAYRIVQEALTNTVRHANASEVAVRVDQRASSLAIDVTDNGSGAPEVASDTDGGHGIQGMYERVEALGGSFEAGPVDGDGFRVHATIPLSGRPS